ncbi:MAG: hypothetical protein ACMUIA_01980 [bacterium]
MMGTCFFMLIVFGVCFRHVPSRALSPENSPESSSRPELHEKIKMEEMKIHGDVPKPHIMYIIPRANLHLDPIMYDSYFLPSSPESPEDKGHPRKGPAAHRETVPSAPAAGYHLQANAPEVKAGSCILCHYPGMIIPQDHHTQSLVKELNQLCLQCHQASFSCLNREEVYTHQPDRLSRPNEFDTDTFCKVCHRSHVY